MKTMGKHVNKFPTWERAQGFLEGLEFVQDDTSIVPVRSTRGDMIVEQKPAAHSPRDPRYFVVVVEDPDELRGDPLPKEWL